MPYTPTWNNPYLPQNTAPLGQSFSQQYTTPIQYQQPVNGITKVNGRDSAIQYQLPPNSTSPALFDNNGRVFYIVTTDGTGAKTVETFDFTQHVDEKPLEIDGAQFVSKEEYDQFVSKVSAALEALNGVYATVPAESSANGFGKTNVNTKTTSTRRQRGGDKQPVAKQS